MSPFNEMFRGTILAATEAWKEKYYGEETELSERAAATKEYLSGKPFGCENNKAVGLAEALLGEKLTEEAFAFDRWVCVIPLENGTHNYPVGIPVLIHNASGRGISVQGVDLGPVPLTQEEVVAADESYINQFLNSVDLGRFVVDLNIPEV